MQNTLTNEASRLEAKSPRVRKWLISFLVIVIVLAICVAGGVRWFLLQTEYTPSFSKAQFKQVRSGDALATVFDRLKEPLTFTIISQAQNDNQFKPQDSDEISTIPKWTNNDSVLLILHYSKPRNPGGSYHAYEIWIHKGKVQETRTYNYWD
jgi:hypothetical protein